MNVAGLPALLKACDNLACDHQTSMISMFCCGPCEMANAGRFDPEGYHTEACMQRHAERGPSRVVPSHGG